MPFPLPVAGLDFETTGHSRRMAARPMEIGLCVLSPSGKLDILLDCLVGEGAHGPMNHYAYDTHGIPQSACRGKPSLRCHWNTLTYASDQGICVHAKSTEKKILGTYFPLDEFTWLDTLPLARKFLPGLPNYRLETLSDELDRTKDLRQMLPNKTWHQALFDAAASLLCLETIYDNVPAAKTHLHEIWKIT